MRLIGPSWLRVGAGSGRAVQPDPEPTTGWELGRREVLSGHTAENNDKDQIGIMLENFAENAAGQAAAGERHEAYVRGHQLDEIRKPAGITRRWASRIHTDKDEL